jgi:hypothetical protein
MEKKEKEEENMAKVIVTRPMLGLCHMQVCAIKDVTDETLSKEAVVIIKQIRKLTS